MSTVVFLGGGRITSAMLAGLRLAKTGHRLVVHDRNPGKLRDLKKRYAVAVESDLNSALKQADVLIVAVRPSSVREVIHAIGNVNRALLGRTATLAVSLAAGVPLRVLTAVIFPRTLLRADRKRVHDFFASFGQVVEIPESKFDAFTVTYSCSHGYHALATLAGTAQAAGLDRNTALLASAHALADGIIAWRDGKHSLEALLAEAATPGGIAAATTARMDAAGYGRAVRQGVAAGLRRARENAGK